MFISGPGDYEAVMCLLTDLTYLLMISWEHWGKYFTTSSISLTVLFPWQHFQITKYIKKGGKKIDICSGKDTQHLPEDLWLWDGRPSNTDTESEAVLELHLKAVVGTPGPGSAPGVIISDLFIFLRD